MRGSDGHFPTDTLHDVDGDGKYDDVISRYVVQMTLSVASKFDVLQFMKNVLA